MAQMESKVAVIILNWNGKEDTLECLDSVYKMDYPHLEVIVVDNGSSDNSVGAIRERFKDVVLIENKANLGFCAGNNTGIRYALSQKPDYLLILNNDAVVAQSLIKELKAVVDSDSLIGAVSPIITFYHNQDLIYFAGTKIDWGNGDFCAQYPWQFVESAKKLLDIDFTGWCATFMKREVMEKVGLLDEQFFAYYDDADWGARARAVRLRTVLYPKKLVRHKVSTSTGGSFSPSVYFYLFRNRLFFMRKHASFLRKLQFSFCYVRDSYKKYKSLLKDNERERAEAVIDAFWSALNNCLYDKRLGMPQKLKVSLNIFTPLETKGQHSKRKRFLTGWTFIFLWGLTLKAVLRDGS